MHYEARYNSDSSNEGRIVDWRNANAKSRSSKLRIFMKRSISKFWKKKFAACTNLVRERSTFEQPADRPVFQERANLCHTDQLTSMAGVIEDAMANFGRVRECHRAAARQLNAADYALQDLLGELVAAIPTMAANAVPQAMPLTVAEAFQEDIKPVVTQQDDALAA